MDSIQFLSLSSDLVGDTHLDSNLAASLLERLVTGADTATLKTLDSLQSLAAKLPYDPDSRQSAISAQIMADPTLRELAKTIIVLWYTGDLLTSNTTTMPAEHYFSGQIWSIARAHPPGLSGGYFGHWTYPPDN
jgi:hypothetical protein